MDTGILARNAGSCHDNKSQRVDPFIGLTHSIAGKTKYVKDRFWRVMKAKARYDKACRRFCVFWEKWGNARTNRIGGKREETRKGKMRDA